jgi:nucleotide-binding universal stress UspA family protein
VYERVVVALDGSRAALRVLPHVGSFADDYGAEVMLLRVVPPLGSPLARPA